MKTKHVDSIKVQFTTLMAQKYEILTFVPQLETDPTNGEIYVQNIYCLEQQKEFSVAPFMTVNLLPGYLQATFPLGRIITNPAKD